MCCLINQHKPALSMNTEQWILNHEQAIRLAFFFGVFVLVALWEVASPQRVLKLSRRNF